MTKIVNNNRDSALKTAPRGKYQMETHAEKIERALAYPFDVPSHSYIFAGGRAFPLVALNAADIRSSTVLVENDVRPLAGVMPDQAGSQMRLSDLVPILASGSNASPRRLNEKFGTLSNAVIPVLRGTVDHLCPVYSAHITRYGSVSATLQWSQGAATKLSCLFLPPALLETMHRSEFVGRNYGYFKLMDGAFHAEAGMAVSSPHAYLSLWGCLQLEQAPVRLAALDSRGSPWAALSQRKVMIRVHGLTGADQSFDEFILSNIMDDALRLQRIRYLSTHHAGHIDRSHFDRID